MRPNAEKQFEDIAEECAQKAGKVRCSIREYRDGLKSIIERLREAQDAAEADLRKEEKALDD